MRFQSNQWESGISSRVSGRAELPVESAESGTSSQLAEERDFVLAEGRNFQSVIGRAESPVSYRESGISRRGADFPVSGRAVIEAEEWRGPFRLSETIS